MMIEKKFINKNFPTCYNFENSPMMFYHWEVFLRVSHIDHDHTQLLWKMRDFFMYACRSKSCVLYLKTRYNLMLIGQFLL